MFDIKELIREEKREGYRQLCGTPHRLGDGRGGSRVVRFYCHQDGCPTCREIKGETYKARIDGAIGAGYAVMRMDVPSEQAEVIKSKLAKDRYLCLPQEDGNDVLFVASETTEDVSKIEGYLNEEQIDGMDWAGMVGRVSGRKISGGLGRPAKREKEEEEDTYTVQDTTYLFNDHVLAVDVLKEIVRMTYVVSVTGPEEMQELVNSRNEMFEGMYTQRGGKIIARFHRNVNVSGFYVNNSINDSISEGKTSDFNRKSFDSGEGESPPDRAKIADLVG